MLPSLRGQPTPREGAGQLPAFLLDRGQLPPPPPLPFHGREEGDATVFTRGNEYIQNDRKSRGTLVRCGVGYRHWWDDTHPIHSWCSGSPFRGFRKQHAVGIRRGAVVDARRWRRRSRGTDVPDPEATTK